MADVLLRLQSDRIPEETVLTLSLSFHGLTKYGGRTYIPIISRQIVIFIAYNAVTYHCVLQTYTTSLSYMVSEVGVSTIRMGDIKSRTFSIDVS